MHKNLELGDSPSDFPAKLSHDVLLIIASSHGELICSTLLESVVVVAPAECLRTVTKLSGRQN